MIARISRVVADFFVSEHIVPEEQREIYEYGFELIVSSIIGITIVLAIGLVSGKVWESIFFYMVFCFTRLFTGGFHASNHLFCKGAFAAALSAVIAMDWFIREIGICCDFVFYLYSLAVIFLFAPIENPNKELLEREKKKCKIVAVIEMLVWLAVMFLFRILGSGLDHIVALTLFCVANLMLLEIYCERRKTK